MQNKKIVGTIFAIILIVISLSSCGSSKVNQEAQLKNDIQYCWYDRDSAFLYAFHENEYVLGVLSDSGNDNTVIRGTFDIIGSTIEFHSDDAIFGDTIFTELTINDDTMSYVSYNGKKFEFKKVPQEVVNELLK